MRAIRSGRYPSIRLSLPGVLLALTGLIASIFHPVLAQNGAHAALTAPDTSRFPTISFYYEVYDASGSFIPGLKPADLKVLENGSARPVTSLETVQPGLQIMIAYNAGSFMANHTGGKDTLYQRFQTALQAWTATQASNAQDDDTLLGNEGVVGIHRDPTHLTQDIAGYQPDLAKARPSLSSLSQALDITADPLANANMKRALLYITTLPPDNGISALPNLAQRAAKLGLHISVWLAAPTGSEATKGGQALRGLAEDSGGQFFLYTGAETLPNPETYFKPLRSLYQVTYPSAVQKSGEQRLAVSLNNQGMQIDAPAQTFKMDVQAPNPMFIDPPSQVNRTIKPSQGQGEPVLVPSSVPLKILIEFPDGHKRPLKSAKLYVDGALAMEHTSEPFDRFDWDVSGYNSSQRHVLQVKIEDTLGLAQSSIEAPVEMLVEQPKKSWLNLDVQVSPRRLMIAGAVLLAGLALGGVLWMSGRRGWFTSSERRRLAKLAKDPVTQPVRIQQDQPRKVVSPASLEHPSWPLPAAAGRKAPAWLLRLDDNNHPVSGAMIPVTRKEMTIGSNPQQSTCVISAPSVEGLHARLQVTAEGYTLADAGSVAGTWVNYVPVSAAGVRLEHGDLVHFGQAGFRFELASPGPVRKPRVSKYEETL